MNTLRHVWMIRLFVLMLTMEWCEHKNSFLLFCCWFTVPSRRCVQREFIHRCRLPHTTSTWMWTRQCFYDNDDDDGFWVRFMCCSRTTASDQSSGQKRESFLCPFVVGIEFNGESIKLCFDAKRRNGTNGMKKDGKWLGIIFMKAHADANNHSFDLEFVFLFIAQTVAAEQYNNVSLSSSLSCPSRRTANLGM